MSRFDKTLQGITTASKYGSYNEQLEILKQIALSLAVIADALTKKMEVSEDG